MTVRFLIDAQLPVGLARWLTQRGYPSDHVDDLGLHAAQDSEIADRARESRAVVWSKDADFAERALRAEDIQVVWLRTGNISNAGLRARLAPRLSDIDDALTAGAVLIEVR